MKTSNPPLNKNNRLGRGLEALLGPTPEKESSLFLDVEKIQPNKKQPRSLFDKKALEELSVSIKENGVLQPILVQKKGENYLIIAGERRWRAACLAGLRKIPAIVRNPKASEEVVWALIENIQRENLSSIEEARALKKIMEHNHWNQDQLAQAVGRPRSSVANTLRILQLDKEVQDLIEEKKISFAQAKELLRFESPKEQREMARKCLNNSWTVKKLLGKRLKKEKVRSFPFWLKNSLLSLEKQFSQRLQLSFLKKGQGKLSFTFKDEDELKRLLSQLLKK